MNESKDLMNAIYETGFVIDDVLLYLDTHPCDEKALEYYESYRKLYLKLTKEYAEKFGPLNKTQINSSNYWTWVKNPWPWEKEAC